MLRPEFSGPVATFTDANPNGSAAEYLAAVNWGDGQVSAGTVTAQAGGGFAITGTHTYTTAGAYSPIVSVFDTLNPVQAVSAGGNAVANFAADNGFSGGSVYGNSDPITNLSGLPNAAPVSVYETTRYGNFTYTLSNLTSGAAYLVQLHFAEIYFNAARLDRSLALYTRDYLRLANPQLHPITASGQPAT